MSNVWRITLLGQLQAARGDQVASHFETRKTAALLAVLGLSLPHARSRETLLEHLWPDEDPEATRMRLRQALAALRRTLEVADSQESVLLTDRLQARLNPALVATDVAEFEAAVASAARPSAAPEERAADLQRAADLYQGELLPGYYEDFIVAERRRLAESHRNALVALSDVRRRLGDADGATQAARQAVLADPCDEQARVALIQSLHAAGRDADALREARELEHVLRQEFDAAPSPATRALIQRIKAAAPDAERPAPPPPQDAPPPAPPVGTVTFLLTDIEGSSRLWEQHPEPMRQALLDHDRIAARTIEGHRGRLVKTRGEGDSLFAVFPLAQDALACAGALQRAFQEERWPAEAPLRVRVALHTGEVTGGAADYQGNAANRCAGLRSLAKGGETLVSLSTEQLVRDSIPKGIALLDDGERRLPGLSRPERVFRLAPADAAPRRPWLTRRQENVSGVLLLGVLLLVSGGRSVLNLLHRNPAPAPSVQSAKSLAVSPSERVGRKSPGNSAAHYLCLQGRYQWNKRTKQSLKLAINDFDSAIKMDPQYAPAYVGKADAYASQGYYGYLPSGKAYRLGQDAAGRAIAAKNGDNDTLADAYSVLAWNAMVYRWELNQAESYFKSSVKYNPSSATEHQWHSLLLMVEGQQQDSLDEINKASQLDPSLSLIIGTSIGGRHYYVQQYDSAVQQYKKMLALNPGYAVTYFWLGLALEKQGRFLDAQQDIRKAAKEENSALFLAFLGNDYGLAGQLGQARAIDDELRGRAKDGEYISPFCLAVSALGAGDTDRAFNLLDQAFKEHDGTLMFLAEAAPAFDFLRGDPRYAALRKKMGLPELPPLRK